MTKLFIKETWIIRSIKRSGTLIHTTYFLRARVRSVSRRGVEPSFYCTERSQSQRRSGLSLLHFIDGVVNCASSVGYVNGDPNRVNKVDILP